MLLLDEIGAPTRSSSRVVVPPRLKVRESTAPPGDGVGGAERDDARGGHG
jgi:hypothetical protein